MPDKKEEQYGLFVLYPASEAADTNMAYVSLQYYSQYQYCELTNEIQHCFHTWPRRLEGSNVDG